MVVSIVGQDSDEKRHVVYGIVGISVSGEETIIYTSHLVKDIENKLKKLNRIVPSGGLIYCDDFSKLSEG